MPTDKRARQRAGRAARMAELQRAQQRRNRTRRAIVVGVVVALAVGLAIYTGTQGGSSKKVKTSSATTTPLTTVPTSSSTVALGTGLVARSAPAVSASCSTPAGGPTGSGASSASGNGVSIVPAPQHVPFPHLDGSSPRYTKFSAAPPFCLDVSKTYNATVKTDAGSFVVQLLPKYAPLTVNNFVFLAGYHFYDGIVFHRVIPGFMDQVGDPTATGSSGPGYSFADELPSSNTAYDPGAMAMANSGPNTNGSQFFIVVPGGGSGLSPSYSVFGQVMSGMDVVEKINSDGSQAGTPAKYHKILS
ncbi:MAG TPA: peptidylprolyl isomerase, partial [Acidimicrobiales bacterium]|nr:peptidylprolyl isomerase [Acidimicrobiales bacterium]